MGRHDQKMHASGTMSSMKPQDLVTDTFRLMKQQKAALEKLRIRTLEDLLFHFPSRYEDVSQAESIANITSGLPARGAQAGRRLAARRRRLLAAQRGVDVREPGTTQQALVGGAAKPRTHPALDALRLLTQRREADVCDQVGAPRRTALPTRAHHGARGLSHLAVRGARCLLRLHLELAQRRLLRRRDSRRFQRSPDRHHRNLGRLDQPGHLRL